MSESNAMPQALAYVEARQSQWAVYIQCPYCGDLHSHGGGPTSGPPDLGHRVSHCLDSRNPGYVLVPGPEGMEKPKALGRLEKRKLQQASDLAFSKLGGSHG